MEWRSSPEAETQAADSFGSQEQKTIWDVYLVCPASRRLRRFVLVPVKRL